MPKNAAKNPRTGLTTSAVTTFSTPSALISPTPRPIAAAPQRPPMSACDDDEGIPPHHVSRFQKMAPMSAASTIACVTDVGSMMSLPIVEATRVPRNAPTTFRTAAISTAVRGRSTPVDTTVAIAFAVSWKPVDEVEDEGHDDDDDDESERRHVTHA